MLRETPDPSAAAWRYPRCTRLRSHSGPWTPACGGAHERRHPRHGPPASRALRAGHLQLAPQPCVHLRGTPDGRSCELQPWRSSHGGNGLGNRWSGNHGGGAAAMEELQPSSMRPWTAAWRSSPLGNRWTPRTPRSPSSVPGGHLTGHGALSQPGPRKTDRHFVLSWPGFGPYGGQLWPG